MKVYHQLDQIPSSFSATAVAIGNFDGVHLGHRALLSRLVQDAKVANLVPSVLTFFPHPIEVLRPEKKLECLTTTAEKIDLLAACGIDNILIAKFDRELAALTPETFISRFLENGLKAKRVHVGFNFCFGKNRAGTPEVLTSLCAAKQIQTHVEPSFNLEGERVSSSLVRKAIAAGDVRRAAVLLSAPYKLSGPVIHGDGRGRTIGIPTANIHYSKEKALPKAGVYATRLKWQGQYYKSVTNVGVRPTFKNEAVTSVEVHILDFDIKIYDEFLELEFLDHIRDEKRFESMQHLVEQIHKDINTVRNLP